MALSRWTSARRTELTLRLASAAVLIPFALLVVWKGGVVLALACALFSAIMAYEFVRMTNSPSMKVLVSLALVPCSAAIAFGLVAGIITLLVCAVLAGLAHPLARERLLSGFGLFYVAGMPLALLALREGAWNGQVAALILMGIVWGSDSAAFFTGRSLGGPPLSPDSPSKTWSGAIGAVVFSALCGLLAAHLTGGEWRTWMLVGAAISVAAQVGDMLESLLKRRLGVKDASKLMPGHGGVMDRVDGLGFASFIGCIVLTLPTPFDSALGLNA